MDKVKKTSYRGEQGIKIAEKEQAELDKIIEASGGVTIGGENSKLIAFIYVLLRDKLPAGEVYSLIKNVGDDTEYKFCNGWLAKYSEYLVNKLVNVDLPDVEDPNKKEKE